MPYDRKNIMISEIESFISRLQVKAVMREDLIFEGKEKDEHRFPNYDLKNLSLKAHKINGF